jgi:hypothetical protein
MPCPWLKEEGDVYKCTAVSPPVELDFESESPKNVNGKICNYPEPTFMTSPPWSQCERWKAK